MGRAAPVDELESAASAAFFVGNPRTSSAGAARPPLAQVDDEEPGSRPVFLYAPSMKRILHFDHSVTTVSLSATRAGRTASDLRKRFSALGGLEPPTFLSVVR